MLRLPRTACFAMALAAVTAVAACKGPPPATGAEPVNAATAPKTTLQVTNRNFYDMNVFLLAQGQRFRVGTATGNNATSTFQFPSQLVENGSVQFLATPIGAAGADFTQPLDVRPGDVVSVTIQP
ncbi:MAG TPA: hypothetical protein VFW66_14975 [Gemmatimonadales bacterium]|nr:hypothetical protein [Gemmatimonadales bacterium]